LDDRYSNPNFNGYKFTVSLSSSDLNYTAYANGVSNTTSRYDYYSGPDFVIRYSSVMSRSPSGMTGYPVQ
jgi:hypothetical protein